jgi:hypothetical protein
MKGALKRLPLAAAVLAGAFSFSGAIAPAQADPFVATLPVSVSGPTTVLEGTTGIEYSFGVTNNTGHNLNITDAFALIQFVSGDATDLIQFSRGIGLLTHNNFIPSGAVGHYVYSVDAPGVPDGTTDFGLYSLIFFIELSDIPPEMVPQTGGNFQTSLLLGAPNGNDDPQAGQVLAFCGAFPTRCPGQTDFLFPPSLNPGFDVFGGAANLAVTIADAPEPSSIALISTAGLVLIGFGWRNRPARRQKTLAGTSGRKTRPARSSTRSPGSSTIS